MQEIHQLGHETRFRDAENPAGRTMAAMVSRMARMAAARARNVDQCESYHRGPAAGRTRPTVKLNSLRKIQARD